MRYKKIFDPNLDVAEQVYAVRGVDEFDAMVMGNKLEGERPILSSSGAKAFMEATSKSTLCFADYDADGVTAAAIARLGLECDVVIPERNEGYGLTAAAVRRMDQLYDTILTVDCGITAKDSVDYVKSWESNPVVIITDHHEIQPDNLPEADLIVHPKLAGMSFTGYSGSGVIYKVVKQLYGDVHGISQLAAIGTICDVMPMIDENRKIVRDGIDSIRREPLPGVRALCAAAGVNYLYITEEDIGFYVGPLINACGRMGKAKLAYDILSSENYDEALDLSAEAKALNSQRKELTRRLVDDAPKKLIYSGNIRVYIYEDMSEGLAGLVANSLAKEFSVATVVLYRKNDSYIGSCRSGGLFSCQDILHQCHEWIENGGGHKGAAGLTIKASNLRQFIESVSELSTQILFKDTEYTADFSIDFDHVYGIINEVLSLRPFGNGFEAPTFLTTLKEYEIVAYGTNKNHIRIKVDGVDFMIFYSDADELKKLAGGNPLRVAYKIGSPYSIYTKKPSMIVEKIEVVK
jgi:single-stranded-DNA-specific exonuclease